MTTELDTYIEKAEVKLTKGEKFLVEIKPHKEGLEKSIGFYTVIEYNNPILKKDCIKHFWFVSKNLDEKDIELGVANLREQGYIIAYNNYCKQQQI